MRAGVCVQLSTYVHCTFTISNKNVLFPTRMRQYCCSIRYIIINYKYRGHTHINFSRRRQRQVTTWCLVCMLFCDFRRLCEFQWIVKRSVVTLRVPLIENSLYPPADQTERDPTCRRNVSLHRTSKVVLTSRLSAPAIQSGSPEVCL